MKNNRSVLEGRTGRIILSAYDLAGLLESVESVSTSKIAILELLSPVQTGNTNYLVLFIIDVKISDSRFAEIENVHFYAKFRYLLSLP